MPSKDRQGNDPHRRFEKASRKYVDSEPKDNTTITRHASSQSNTYTNREDPSRSRRDRDVDYDPENRSRDVVDASRRAQNSHRRERERPSELEPSVLSQGRADRNIREQNLRYRNPDFEHEDYITPQNRSDEYRQEQRGQRRPMEADQDSRFQSQSNTNTAQSSRNQRDRSRDTVPTSPRASHTGNPIVLTSQPDLPDDVSESDSAENDALRGLSPSAKVFLRYNIVSGDFISQSVDYLKNQPMLRRQDVAEWRDRGRSALRMGNAELARKLIQQAWLIELWQEEDYDGVEGFLRRETVFEDFIKETYPTFLYFLEEAESEGRFDGRRAQMLEPWATFVKWVCGEDISQTLSTTPRSESRHWVSDFVAKATNSSPSPQAYLKNNVRSSAPSLQRPDTTHRTSTEDKRQFLGSNTVAYPGGAATVVSSRVRSDASTPKNPVLQFSQGPISRAPEAGRNERRGSIADRGPETLRGDSGGMADRGSAPAQTQSNADQRLRKAVYRQGPQANPPHRQQTTGRDARPEESTEDDESDTDGEEDNNPRNRRQETVVERTSRKGKEAEVSDDGVEVQEASRYIHTRGPVPLQSEPRHMKTDLPNHTRAPTAKPPTTVPPPNPISRLPGLLLQFFGMRTHQECWKYCERYTQIFDEDIAIFQKVAADCLREGREQTANQVIERWIMLKNAKSAQEGAEEYMKRLPKVPKRQQDLKQDCDKALKALRERVRAVSQEERPSSSLPPQRSGQRPSIPASQRQVAQSEHTRSKQGKPVKSG